MALPGSAWLRCPGRPLSVAPTHPAPARVELQTLRWVPRPTLDPELHSELQLESQSVLPLVSCPRCLCLPYANYEQATSHAPPKLNLDAQISTCPTKRLCPRLWHRFRLLSSDLRESQTAQHKSTGGGEGGKGYHIESTLMVDSRGRDVFNACGRLWGVW